MRTNAIWWMGALWGVWGWATAVAGDPEVPWVPLAQFANPVVRSVAATEVFRSCLGTPSFPARDADMAHEAELRRVGDEVGLDLFLLAPDVYWRWVRRADGPGVVSSSAAAHETSHFVNGLLRVCTPTVTSYYFWGRVYALNLGRGDSVNYSRLAALVPTALAALRDTFRFQHYTEQAKRSPGNNFRILLDELVSSLAGASAEISRYGTQSAMATEPAKPVLLNADVVGAQEFAAWVALLGADMKRQQPDAWRQAMCTGDGAALLRALWLRVQDVQRAQAHWASQPISPRPVVTPAAVAATLQREEVREVFLSPCDP